MNALIDFCLIMGGLAVGALLGTIIATAIGLRATNRVCWPLDDEGQP